MRGAKINLQSLLNWLSMNLYQSSRLQLLDMKTILTEAFSVIKVSLFWMLALPLAAIIVPVAVGWERLGSLVTRGPIISTRSLGSQLRVVAR